ncbi:hypothetical protein GSI_13740 [Ganoderma sinense ZZ0214-1]|uniref:DUF7918 domain-containing protein n=1 Tax=Ganoderma sinense ZZ0214-1 TaxID=1077348 RepID=A0A2G8RR54_9APHY|nr:hypothetical protein GSI_13740 [Ganoderma sinense ZZ0214-1]
MPHINPTVHSLAGHPNSQWIQRSPGVPDKFSPEHVHSRDPVNISLVFAQPNSNSLVETQFLVCCRELQAKDEDGRSPTQEEAVPLDPRGVYGVTWPFDNDPLRPVAVFPGSRSKALSIHASLKGLLTQRGLLRPPPPTSTLTTLFSPSHFLSIAHLRPHSNAATMLDHRGFSAYITTNKLELVEFEPRVDQQTHTVTCWIEGPVGQPFVVHWRDHGSKVDSASWIYVDGFKVSGQFLYGRGHELRRGVRVGSEEERPFMFAQIHPADFHAHGAHGGNPADKNVGSIVLEIRLIKRVGEREPNPVRPPPSVVRGNRQPGEVAIRYGNAHPTAMQQRTYKIEPFDPKAPGPYVTFIFRYRSRDWLASQGIISHRDVTSRLLILPDVALCSKADLPPLEPEEDQAASPAVPSPASGRRVSSKSRAQPPAQASSSRLPPPPTPGPSVRLKDLGLGHRPQGIPETSRVSSATTSRSFSGTWDHRTPFNDPYEQWNEYEYRPEDLDDALNNYYP